MVQLLLHLIQYYTMMAHGGRETQFKHSTPQHNMEVTAQPHDPTALILGKEPVYSTHSTRHPPPHQVTQYTWKDQITIPWLSSPQPRDCYNWANQLLEAVYWNSSSHFTH